MELHVLHNLEDILARVVKAAKQLDVSEVNLIDGGDGQALAAYVGAYPAMVGKLLSEVSQSIGVDLRSIIGGKTDTSRNGTSGVGLSVGELP